MENQKKLEFFKNKIKERLKSIENDIPAIRYKLWIAAVDACEDYNELREMAELDMQLDVFEYTKKEINPKLEKLNIGIEELRGSKGIAVKGVAGESGTTGASGASGASGKKSDFNLAINNAPIEEYTAEELMEDINDPEIDAAMAAILMNRILTEPMEELHREDMLDSINEKGPSLDDLDLISDEDMYELGNIGDSVELDESDFDIDEDELLEEESNEESSADSEESSADSEESSLFDDFSDIETEVVVENKQEEEFDPFEIIDTDDEDGEGEGGEEGGDDEEEFDPFDISEDDEDELFGGLDEDELDGEDDIFGELDEDLDEEDSDEELEDDIFGDLDEDELGEDDLFESEDGLFGELDEDELGEDDIFDDTEESDEASFDELENAGDIFDSLDDDDLIGNDEEDEEDSSEENSGDDLFGDLDEDELGYDEESEESEDGESEDEFGDLSDLEDFIDDDDEDDILIEDDSESFFNKPKEEKSKPKSKVREIKSTTVFHDGTDRGKKTQDMFNSINKLGSMFCKMSKKASNETKKAVTKGKNKALASGFFDLDNETEDAIDGF